VSPPSMRLESGERERQDRHIGVSKIASDDFAAVVLYG
jgi:hypothetical protein